MRLVNILYPRRCPICEELLSKEDENKGICSKCLLELKVIKEEIFPNKEAGDVYDGGMCLFAYSSIQSSVYKFKYMNRSAYAFSFAKVIACELGEWIEAVNPDGIIPIPMHKKRLIARGYNQATELANEIGTLCDIKVYDSLVKRFRNTKPLKYLNKEGRRNSMKKAFIVLENVVNLRRVIIIDDIFTTGSTINSIATELKNAGVKEVYFIALSKAGR